MPPQALSHAARCANAAGAGLELAQCRAPFYGVVGPAGLPPAVLSKLNDTLVRALRSPALQAKLTDMGFDVVASSPDEYGKKIRQEIDLWSRIVRDNQIKAD